MRKRKHKGAKDGSKHLRFPARQPGGKHPSGHLGHGMKARGKAPGKKKGHGGGKSVATPSGRHGGLPAGHGGTMGRAVKPMGPTQGSPRKAGTTLGGDRGRVASSKSSQPSKAEKRLVNAEL